MESVFGPTLNLKCDEMVFGCVIQKIVQIFLCTVNTQPAVWVTWGWNRVGIEEAAVIKDSQVQLGVLVAWVWSRVGTKEAAVIIKDSQVQLGVLVAWVWSRVGIKEAAVIIKDSQVQSGVWIPSREHLNFCICVTPPLGDLGRGGGEA